MRALTRARVRACGFRKRYNSSVGDVNVEALNGLVYLTLTAVVLPQINKVCV